MVGGSVRRMMASETSFGCGADSANRAQAGSMRGAAPSQIFSGNSAEGQKSHIRDGTLSEDQGPIDEADKRILKSNQERWWNAAQWERYFMTHDGLLKKSPRGCWELAGGRH